MKAVILAGGLGTRISEESHLKPKPMIEIGDRPILWHIMKMYSAYGINEFVICLGYKGYMIKEFFADYYLHMSDVTFDFTSCNSMTVHQNIAEPWKVTLVDTGLYTQTGSRIKKVRDYIGDERFCLTYGDGVSDVDINELIKFHEKSKSVGTLTSVQPGGRFGVLGIAENEKILSFSEKAKEDGGWINGGFMVFEPQIFDYIGEGNDVVLEREPLETLSNNGLLSAYKHTGFWQCMDTQRDKYLLEDLWISNNAKWKIW